VRTAAIRGVATVRPDPRRESQVVAPIWGRIEWSARPLAVGDAVKKDQELVRLVLELPLAERYAMDTRRADVRTALDVATKRKQQSEIEYNRAVALFRNNTSDSLFKIQVEWQEKIFHAAEEEERLVQAQAAASDIVVKRRDPKVTAVTAPINGIVTEIGFTPGQLDLTQEFSKLFTIVDPSQVWLEAEVFEKDLDAVRRGRSEADRPGRLPGAERERRALARRVRHRDVRCPVIDAEPRHPVFPRAACACPLAGPRPHPGRRAGGQAS